VVTADFIGTPYGKAPASWRLRKGSDVVIDSKSGDWGKGEPGESLEPVRVIRGTDFPRALKGNMGEIPKRFTTAGRLAGRCLSPGNLLVEMSGGSAAQATGRLLLVPKELVSRTEVPLVFSNFVKRVLLADGVDAEFIFWQWMFLYERGRTRVYERRTTGIRNFKLDSFLQNESFVVPPLPEQRQLVARFQAIERKIDVEVHYAEALEVLFKTLLEKLMTGVLPVNFKER
jgi:type I restriction enzyme S subunit